MATKSTRNPATETSSTAVSGYTPHRGDNPEAKPSHSGENSHAFQELIERAALSPETFQAKVVPLVEKNPAYSIPLLIKEFGSTNAGLKALIADLFKNPLKGHAAKVLLPLLEENDEERFFWAATVLSEIREMQAVPGLTRGLSTGKKKVIMASMKGLSNFGDKASLEALIDFLLHNSDWGYLSAVLRYLAPNAGEAVPLLLERYPHLPGDRQAWVLKFFAEVADIRALPLFTKVLADEPLKLGLFCISGLGKIGTPEAVKALSDAQKHPEWFIRKRVVDALGNAKCREAVACLIKALTDPSVQVRAGSIESLSKVGRLDLDLIVQEMEKGEHDLRVGLIRICGQIHDARLVQPLVKTLSDRSTLFFSLDALGDLGFVDAAPALEAFLKDPEWFNRLNALEALGKLQIPHIRALAEKCLEDPNDMVRNAAERIFAKT